MPHLFVNRPRHFNVLDSAEELRSDFRWETLNASLYVIGGGIFIAGSFFFFPRLEEYQDTGCLLFFLGSLLYLVVTTHDMLEVRRAKPLASRWKGNPTGEWISAASYWIGTVLFTAGSVFFSSLLHWFELGAWTFIIGSALFVLGAGVNVVEIVRAKTLLTLQLMNLTAVSFLVGSVLFTVASVPYLWALDTDADTVKLYGFLAWEYLTGSTLFLLGGLLNHWRAYLVRDGDDAG